MHIVDLTLFYGPEAGGVKTYLSAKHNYLARVKHIRHSIVVPRTLDSEVNSDLFDIPSVPFPFTRGYHLPIRSAAPVLRELKPDLIEVGDASYLAWEALNVGHELNIPVIGFFHSDLPRILGRRCGAVATRLANMYLAYLYKRFDLVIAPSRGAAQQLRDLGIERVIHEPLGVDTNLFSPAHHDPNLRKELDLPDDVRLLIYVGRFTAEKNLPLLFKAFERLGGNYHLLAVGGPSVASAPVNVSFRPFEFDRSVLARLLASSDGLVHAGNQETFGLAAVEAMASGIPVVGIAGGGIAELVDSSTGVLADSPDIHALCSAIEQLYKVDKAQYGRNAREKMLRQFSWDRVIHRLLNVYTQLTIQKALHSQIQGKPSHAIE
jgi:alpha-1,6-mannosyltransferase